MKKKSVSLLLALTLVFSLLPTALAAEGEAVTPTPPEWINEEDYLIFPGDEVYEPENWAKVEAMREEARSGALLVTDGSEHWAEGSPGMCYETALVRIKYGLNAGIETDPKKGRRAFYSAGRAFSAAQDDYWGGNGKPYDELYYRLELEQYRAWAVYSATYASDWKYILTDILPALNMTMDDFFAGQYMNLMEPGTREIITADMQRIEILLDEDKYKLPLDVPPEVTNQRTMVPIRAVAEALGATVEWVQDTQQIVMTRAGVTVTMTLNSTTATIDDQPVEMDVAPHATNGRTLIPARYVAEFFGQKVDWDGARWQVLITEDKSVAGDSNLEAWALPMGAMLFKLNRFQPEYFGFRSASAAEGARESLNSGSWNIPDRDDLAYTVLSMTLYGHDASFREMAADVKLRTEEERAAISAASDAWPSYMWEYTEYVDEKWGDRGIMAWDLFRMSNLVQWGYSAGYVTYEEALALLEPAATLLCENFSSWDEAYENYLDGYNWWARNDVLGQDIWETSRGKTYLEMKADPELGFIFDDTLFETGVIGLPEET